MLELYRYVPKEALDKAIADGFVSARKHPDAKIPLTILNYTHKTTIEGMWNDVTTKCRGLIYNHRNLYRCVPTTCQVLEHQRPEISRDK
jgi:hypothetical protein